MDTSFVNVLEELFPELCGGSSA